MCPPAPVSHRGVLCVQSTLLRGLSLAWGQMPPLSQCDLLQSGSEQTSQPIVNLAHLPAFAGRDFGL